MSKSVLPTAWWHQAQPMTDPLEVIKIAALHLEQGTPVPDPAGKRLAAAFRQYLANGKDLANLLGLTVKRGKKTLVSSEHHSKRNGMIKAVFNGLSGGKVARSKQVVALLHGSPPSAPITEADVMAYVLQLRKDYGSSLPRSWEQVSRIANKAD